MSEHAIFSPSGASKWRNCAAALYMEKDIPDVESPWARAGTNDHDFSARLLTTCLSDTEFKPVASEFIGTTFEYYEGETKHEYEVTEDSAEAVQTYVDLVLDYSRGHQLLVEQRVNYSDAICQPNSFGTSDAIVLTPDEIIIIDAKYGQGVKVEAEQNEQLMLYGLGALNEYGMIGDFKTVKFVISQPRLDHVSEWSCTVRELLSFGYTTKILAEKAAAILREEAPVEFNPDEKQCRWCRAKATCPALYSQVNELTLPNKPAEEDPMLDEDGDLFAYCYSKVPMVKLWCAAIEERALQLALQGKEIYGYKLVAGREGDRAWSDEAEVEKLMKRSMRIVEKDMYEPKKLISPTKAEKLLKKNSPIKWEKLQDYISRSEGKPKLVPETDKREALTIQSAALDFDHIIATVEEI